MRGRSRTKWLLLGVVGVACIWVFEGVGGRVDVAGLSIFLKEFKQICLYPDTVKDVTDAAKNSKYIVAAEDENEFEKNKWAFVDGVDITGKVYLSKFGDLHCEMALSNVVKAEKTSVVRGDDVAAHPIEELSLPQREAQFDALSKAFEAICLQKSLRDVKRAATNNEFRSMGAKTMSRTKRESHGFIRFSPPHDMLSLYLREQYNGAYECEVKNMKSHVNLSRTID